MDQWGQQISETTNPSKLSPTLLNGMNYLSWDKSVTISLSGRDKIEFITGDKTKPKPTDPTKPSDAEKIQIQKWQKEDHIVMGLLYGSMEQQIIDLFIQSCETSKKLWDELKSFYGQQKNHSHVYRLQLEIQQERKGTRTHLEYLASLKKKYDELDVYRPFTTDITELKKRKEEDQIFSYLAGFDSTYEVIRSQIIRSPDLPSFSEVVNQIQREAMGGPQASHGKGHEPHGHAVRFPQFSQNPSSQIHQNRQNSRSEKCSYCKKEGHKSERCYFLHPNLRPKWWKEMDSKKGGGDRSWKEEKGNLVSHAKGFSAQIEQNITSNNPAGSGEPGPGGPSGSRPGPSSFCTGIGNGSPFCAGGSTGNGSGAGDPVQQLLQQLTVLLSNGNQIQSSCGPDNRGEDW